MTLLVVFYEIKFLLIPLADLVYSEEIIDWRLLRTKRMVNDKLGIVEYIDESDGTTVFSTCQEERNKVILQLGTSDPDRALKVGLLLQDDIAGKYCILIIPRINIYS